MLLLLNNCFYLIQWIVVMGHTISFGLKGNGGFYTSTRRHRVQWTSRHCYPSAPSTSVNWIVPCRKDQQCPWTRMKSTSLLACKYHIPKNVKFSIVSYILLSLFTNGCAIRLLYIWLLHRFLNHLMVDLISKRLYLI